MKKTSKQIVKKKKNINFNHIKKTKNLIIVFFLITVFLSMATYAWFVGMRTVNITSFDVDIASTDDLLLSLNGQNWAQEVSISESTLNTYDGNTNNWGGRGLIPISTIGEMDQSSSRMKLYEKASLTATKGGYRLLASRIDNYSYGVFEQDGYVVFDLFIKNASGTQYIKELNPLDEEAIYLTTDSSVTVASDGVADTGIENSVRVAFGEVGRVSGGTTIVKTITGITCSNTEYVTGICRQAQIWEPNDTKHILNAINWYNTSCKARTGFNVTLESSYNGSCGTVINNATYPTYAVGNVITSGDNVDIYDGYAYNKYTKSTLLVNYPYFTDTKKDLMGTVRPTFMTLAPNSITKVRIYVYIEGQDIDNYDFASIGKKITVNFGFTKERFTATDVDYEGPDLNQ